MEECKSVSIPMGKKEKLQKYYRANPTDEGLYMSSIGCHRNMVKHHVSCKYPLHISKSCK